MKKYLFVLSFVFTFVPLTSALALGLASDKYQGIVNGLYDISNAIDTQTRALENAQMRQKLSELNQECVVIAYADINANSSNLKQIERQIEDYNAQIAGKPRDGEEQVSDASYLNHLYSLVRIHKQHQANFVISTCSLSTLNADCVKANGPNAEFKSYDANGTQCQWKSTNSAPTQTLTLDQQCKNSFGIHSIGYGATKCVCETGYQWASDGKSCAPALDTNAVSVSSAEQCKAKYGSNSSWNPFMKGSAKCGCESGYVMSGNTCVAISNPTPTPVFAGGSAASGGMVESPANQLAAVSRSVESLQVPEATSTAANSEISASTSSPKYKGLRAYVVDIWSWFSGLFGR